MSSMLVRTSKSAWGWLKSTGLSGSLSYERDSESGDLYLSAWYDLKGAEIKFDIAIYPKSQYRFAVGLGVVGFSFMYFV